MIAAGDNRRREGAGSVPRPLPAGTLTAILLAQQTRNLRTLRHWIAHPRPRPLGNHRDGPAH